jgi:hypothetical protein
VSEKDEKENFTLYLHREPALNLFISCLLNLLNESCHFIINHVFPNVFFLLRDNCLPDKLNFLSEIYLNKIVFLHANQSRL